MVQLPDFLEKFRKGAQKLLPQVGHIAFSGSTYQVQVQDPKESEDVWPFLQLNHDGTLKDGFCSCDSAEDVSRCVHLAAAYLKIYSGQPHPLHERFADSFWQHLCYHFSQKLGSEIDLLSQKGKTFSIQSSFSVKAKTKQGQTLLDEWLHERRMETEETSLKFSNLSEEEIRLWREGRPSASLQYALSFWNDFAQWMMQQQDNDAPYTISFEPADELPKIIHIEFTDLSFTFELNIEDWAPLIKSFSTVKSPLKIHDIEDDTIQKMVFDEENYRIDVISTKNKAAKSSKGMMIGEWKFVPGEGFYAQHAHRLLDKPYLEGDDLIKALEHYPQLIASKLENEKVETEPKTLKYHLFFDDRWNLHINAYIHEIGDLDDAVAFGDWFHITGVGFIRVQKKRFDQAKTVIRQHDVGEFVQTHRTWMNFFPGYATHLASIEGHLSYHLSPDNHLSFSRHVVASDDEERSHDFGEWVYLEGQGFYSKVGTVTGLPLQPGIIFQEKQIAPFIRTHREDLRLIPKFFTEQSPIKSAGLIIKLTEDEKIRIQPHLDRQEEFEKADLRFFEDFVYTPGEGFYQLPLNKQLPQKFKNAFILPEEEIMSFFGQELPELRKTYSIIIDPRLRLPHDLHLILMSVVDKEQGHYGLKMAYQAHNFQISIPEIWDALQNKKHYFFHHAGILDLKHPRYDWIRHIPAKRIDRRNNTVTLSSIELIKLNIFDPLTVKAEKQKDADRANELIQSLTKFEVPHIPDTTGLQSVLRSYQQSGLQWLWFLYLHNLSGLLCDDMGLGKTHQAMALIAAIRNKKPGSKFLVLCPTSVIYHWQDKLKDFLPDLNIRTYYGPDRNVTEPFDLLLSSYGIWRMDYKLLKKQKFELAVFDEIQMAKNETSRLHTSLLHIEAQMRLGMTGTPIENYLRELKALFDITLPNYMPGTTLFRDLFVIPIEKENDPKATAFLQKLIDPFVLRRKKEEVLKDLPPKTEEVYHCALLPEQQVLYQEVLQRSREQLLNGLRDKNNPIPYMHIFAILSALKQICDHPAVYLKKPENFREHRSGKWDLFIELINEARDSKQKVVVYSQYLGMLDIIESYLRENKIEYASIRGATTNRGEQIKRFNNDPNCEIFVGSLQASGLGIDLTAASVVIHYDRWWNAARENQATDRVHRIGQQRGVQVFKLVTKNTFEERIDQLIQSKAKLMESVVTTDDQHLIKYLSRDELINLLKYDPN